MAPHHREYTAMPKFFIAENNQTWTPVKAKTLAGAKRAVVRNRVFAGTTLWVAVQDIPGVSAVYAVAGKLPGQRWSDLDEEG